MELFAEIDVEDSKWNTKGRNIILNLAKKQPEEDYWPRLQKEKVKNNLIAIDWQKWVDEDEEPEEGKNADMDWDPSAMQDFGGMGGMGGMPGMGGMGGMPGMGGMAGMGGDSDDEEDSDEEAAVPGSKDPLGDLDKEEVDDGKQAA